MSIHEKVTEFAGLPVIEYHPAVGIVLPTMPRREFRFDNGMVENFWAITLSDGRLVMESGKVGTAGKTEVITCPTPSSSQVNYALACAIIKEGYTERKMPAASTLGAILAALTADPDDGVSRMALADYLSEQGEGLSAAAYRVDGGEYGEEGYGTLSRLDAFLADPAASLVQALVIGSCWAMADSSQTSEEVVGRLIRARDRLASIRSLFLGDITYRECEISWIRHGDLTPLLNAFPKLEHFRTRGGEGLVLRPFRQDSLKSLTLEASNLSREVVRAIGASDLPALEHLELWLGTDEYGADTTPDDLAEILRGERLPSLRYLGLRNSHIADDLPPAMVGAPLLKRLRVLDLSLGNMSDRGAEALLGVPGLTRLQKLDLHHHYISPAVVARVQALGVPVDVSDPQEAQYIDDEEPDYRFVAHSE